MPNSTGEDNQTSEMLAMERGGRFRLLLISLLVMVGFSPILDRMPFFHNLGNLWLTLSFLSGLWVVSRQKLWLAVGGLLALPMLFTLWASSLLPIPQLWVVGSACGTLFCCLLIIKILQYIFKVRRVNWDVIFAALVVYLLFGVCWAFAYGLLESLFPGSFNFGDMVQQGPLPFGYFSFVTLTTVGYGDVLPVSSGARSLSNLEALIGQIYLTVLVARLVSLQMSQSRS